MKKLLFVLILLLLCISIYPKTYEMFVQQVFYFKYMNTYAWNGYRIQEGEIIFCTAMIVNPYPYEQKWIESKNYKVFIIVQNDNRKVKIRYSIKKMNVEVIEIESLDELKEDNQI